ncbi:MAG: sugar phosphate nucleotidyltransferase, partial [Nitrososphaerales archaeon]
PFVMYLGDNLLEEGTAPLIAQYAAAPVDAIIGVTPVEHPSSYGVVELQGEEIISIQEKPARPASNLALIGVYLFSPAIHPIIATLAPSTRGELEITDAIWKLHQSGGIVAVRRVNGWWKDTGRPEDLLAANDLVLGSLPAREFEIQGTVATGATITGRVRIGTGSRVEKGARVEGPTVIGCGVIVRGGAIVGPSASVGDRCTVDRSSVRRSILMEGASLVGGLEVHDSVLGRGARLTATGRRKLPLQCVLGDATEIRI